MLGPNHPETLKTRANVAGWTGEAGDAGLARELFAALLPDVKRVLGPDHPDTLTDPRHPRPLHGTGRRPGRGPRAVRGAATRRNARARPQPPGNTESPRSVAGWTGEDDPGQARELFAALLPDVEQVLGPDHPETLKARASHARWTGQAGDPGLARDLFAALLPDVSACSAPTTRTP